MDHYYFLNCLCGSDERLIMRHYANTMLIFGFILSYPALDLFYVNFYYNSKGQAVPLEAWSGPEGSRKLRFPDFMTTVQDVGKIVSLTHRPPLPTGNTPGTHFY
jgi:hypothetical protein